MTDPLAVFATKPFTKWRDLTRYAKPGWIFRGHGKACWPLETTLERCCDRHDVNFDMRPAVEDELIREFKRAYHDYATHVPDPDAMFEWLALMQHHGAPTRLLDFTYSIYVAAYFAVEKAKKTDFVAIWAVNFDWALHEAADRFLLGPEPKIKTEVDTIVSPLDERAERVVKPLFFKDPLKKLVFPANPFYLNERLRVQKGVFLAPGSVEVSFVENLLSMRGHDESKNVFRIVIPSDQVTETRKALFDMNINRRSLFPGLDGYAQALGVYHPVYNREDPLHKAAIKRRLESAP